jgi:hypothetical protein
MIAIAYNLSSIIMLRDLGKALNLSLDRKYLTVGDLRQLVADSKKEF